MPNVSYLVIKPNTAKSKRKYAGSLDFKTEFEGKQFISEEEGDDAQEVL